MFDYQYLTTKHFEGLKKYKYSAIDTSPLSKYVMQPTWNFIVKLIPNWIAPNLLTFVGFLCLVIDTLVLSVLDYDCTSSGKIEGEPTYTIPNWVFTVCGVLLFLAYNLDGLDGKQARKIGVSGPLGEMFDHGLDSYIVFLIPFCLFSVFGRDEYSLPEFRAFLVVASVVSNFYISHWEKYNTGTLYLPWGYDVSMWATSLIFILTGIFGPELFKVKFLNITFMQAFEIVIHSTGLFTTLPVAIYNVYLSLLLWLPSPIIQVTPQMLSYKNRTGKMHNLLEGIRPLFPITILIATISTWILKSPNNVVHYDPRALNLLFGTLFSHIASRLIVAEICDQRCDAVSPLLWPLIVGVLTSLYQPYLEFPIFYSLTLCSILAHVHYGISVALQISRHYKVNCFTVPKTKRK